MLHKTKGCGLVHRVHAQGETMTGFWKKLRATPPAWDILCRMQRPLVAFSVMLCFGSVAQAQTCTEQCQVAFDACAELAAAGCEALSQEAQDEADKALGGSPMGRLASKTVGNAAKTMCDEAAAACDVSRSECAAMCSAEGGGTEASKGGTSSAGAEPVPTSSAPEPTDSGSSTSADAPAGPDSSLAARARAEFETIRKLVEMPVVQAKPLFASWLEKYSEASEFDETIGAVAPIPEIAAVEAALAALVGRNAASPPAAVAPRSGAASERWTGPTTGYEMVRLSKGTSMLGCTEGQICGAVPRAVGEVERSNDLWVGVYELTKAQHAVLSDTAPSRYRDCPENCAMDNLSFLDVARLANAMSRMDELPECYTFRGRNVIWADPTCSGYRLPTDAEWEAFARANTHDVLPTVDPENYAWSYDNSDGQPHPVGEFSPNALGIYDLGGNMWEWVWDWWSVETESIPSEGWVDPLGPSVGLYRTLRGGSFMSPTKEVNIGLKRAFNPNTRFDEVGVRYVRTIEP